jgi:site-specific DNA-methyltransferase (adenine-specific)
MSQYQVIYPDPPWAYDNKRTGGSLKSGAAQKYPVMTTAEICALPVPDLADKNSVCFLWATMPMLPDAFEVLKYWGYKYKTGIVWHKTGRNGLGYWFRGEIEILLLGKRGKVKPFRCQLPNFIEHPVLGHSEKPEAFRRLIETATVGMEPKIELFARNKAPGWDAWGNEVDGDITI